MNYKNIFKKGLLLRQLADSDGQVGEKVGKDLTFGIEIFWKQGLQTIWTRRVHIFQGLGLKIVKKGLVMGMMIFAMAVVWLVMPANGAASFSRS